MRWQTDWSVNRRERSEMTEDTRIDEPRSIDTVIRGFTNAELALREVSGAVERIRNASAQLDEARDDQAAARAALEQTVSALNELGSHLDAVVGGLRESVEVLSAIEPERLWRHLEGNAAALQTVSEQTTVNIADARATIERRIDQSDARALRTMRVAAIYLAVSLLNLIVLIAFVVGLVPIQ